ncbi:hypothetical protein B566_EDAN004030 [Ephemera danica]|nr:hypothetical protein B566_EDAN004030 [Ephemera danica]
MGCMLCGDFRTLCLRSHKIPLIESINMLPQRLILLRSVRCSGYFWSPSKLFSTKDRGEKGPSEIESDTNVKNETGGNASKNDKIETKSEPHEKSTDAKLKSREASLKLNELLKLMLKEEPQKSSPSKTAPLTLSKPKQKKRERNEPGTSHQTDLGTSLVKAAEKVAASLGGDEKQTQSDLLEQMAKASSSHLVKEAPSADKAAVKNKVPKTPINLSELIAGMKVEHSSEKEKFGRAQQVRQILTTQPPEGAYQSVSATMLHSSRPASRQQGDVASRAGLNEGVPFGFFAHKTAEPGLEEQHTSQVLDTWQQQQQTELALAITHPPSNVCCVCVGMEEESNIPFSEHVFLERHLEDWCPKRGPVRHFMELVCVGLSKNPYLTVEAKHEHMNWYREYFTQKQPLLEEIGAIL